MSINDSTGVEPSAPGPETHDPETTALAPATTPTAPTVAPLPTLKRGKTGSIDADRENAVLMLEHLYPDLWLNDFDGDAYYRDTPIDDGLMVDIMVAMSLAAGVSFQCTAVEQAVTWVVRRNRRHPLADLLRSLEWDGKPRLERLLPDYFGTPDDDLHRRLGLLWAVGAVSRPLAPGGKLDHTLILIGEQGTGKSTAVEVLALRPEWFNDTPADLRSKDARLALRGTWLMELAELDSLHQATLPPTTPAIRTAARAWRAARQSCSPHEASLPARRRLRPPRPRIRTGFGADGRCRARARLRCRAAACA